MGKECSMNRLMKGILYITAGCIGIGCAALILGIVLGGGKALDTDFEWIKDRARNMAAVAEKNVHNAKQDADAAVKGRGIEYDAADETYQEYSGDDFSGDVGIFTADASSIQGISIDLRHVYFSVEESDDSRVMVSVDNDVRGVKASCESGVLTIQDERTGKKGREDASVYLEIPEGMQLDNVKIRIDAGVLYSECSFAAKNLSVDAGAGELSLSDLSANAFAASVGAGTLTVADSSFDTAKLDCGVGTMDIAADIKGNAQMDCGMGTIYVELGEDVESVNYELECGAGSIQIGDSTYSGLAKKSQLNNGSQATFTLSCGMGQICID